MIPTSYALSRITTSMRTQTSKCSIEGLPIELLQEIFFEICRDAPPVMKAQAATLQLSHVSSHWRQATISTPALWANMLVNLGMRQQGHSSPELLKLWLHRSRPLPLTLDIVGSAGPGPSAATHILVSILLDHVHRWGNVKWSIDDIHTADQFLQHSIGSETVLETLDIHTSRGCADDQIERFPLALRSFKHLRHLTYGAPNTPMAVFKLPLMQLTHLHFSCPIPMDSCCRLLSQCTKLVEVVIMNILKPVSDIAKTKIHLPVLVSCSLGSFQYSTGTLLARLICPNVRSLTLHCAYSLQGDWTDLEIFLTQSHCQPEEIAFYDAGALDGDLVRLLAMPNLQSVQRLSLRCHNLSDRTLALLTGGGSDAQALPHLKTIRLSPCCSSDGKLAEMIFSRWKGIPNSPDYHLKVAEITFRLPYAMALSMRTRADGREAIHKKYKKDIASFQLFRDQGLNLSWH